MDRYGPDVLADARRRRTHNAPVVEASLGEVLENGDFCGEVVAVEKDVVTLEDRFGKRRTFPLGEEGGFLLDGRRVTLVRPRGAAAVAVGLAPAAAIAPRFTASGSLAVANVRAQVAKAGRIFVEGVHDAALVERVWGDDLRIEGVVVEPLHGLDDLHAEIRSFNPGPGRRMGVLVDHLVAGTKEKRIVDGVTSASVLVTGHPYVDVWQAVKPSALGIRAWPVIPRGVDWKTGICEALGVSDTREMWRRVLGSVSSYKDLETPMLTAVERLVDFVTGG